MDTQKSQKKSEINRPLVAVDLFCGIGALTCGLKQAGIHVAAGYDIDGECAYGYEANNGTPFFTRNVSELTGEEIATYYPDDCVKILVGCAPCQPFSTHSNKNKIDPEQDKRWSLLDSFGRLVREVKPDIVSMENVPNIRHHQVFQEFYKTLIEEGYLINNVEQPVFCPNYGIPQTRKRLILLASKFGKPTLIEPTHLQGSYETVEGAISNLIKIRAGEVAKNDPYHKAPSMNSAMLARIRNSKPGGTWLDWDEDLRLPCHKAETGQSYKSVYGRMVWDEPSPTITTQFYNYGTGRFGHPEQDRAISLREGALLQTFPPDYQFVKPGEEVTFTKVGRFIGNAVPVRLGWVIGESIIQHLERHLTDVIYE